MGSSISLISGAVAENCCAEQQSISVANTPHLGEENVQYFVDVSGGAVTLQLPANPSDGDFVEVYDSFGQAATNNITVDGNGNTVQGAGTQTISDAFGSAYYIYSLQAGEWLIASSGGGGGGTVTGFQNGLTLNGTLGELGGGLLQDTIIDMLSNDLVIADTNGLQGEEIRFQMNANNANMELFFAGTGGNRNMTMGGLTGIFIDSNSDNTTLSATNYTINDGVENVFSISAQDVRFFQAGSGGTIVNAALQGIEYGGNSNERYLTVNSEPVPVMIPLSDAAITALEGSNNVEVGKFYYNTDSFKFGYGFQVDSVIFFDESQPVVLDNGLSNPVSNPAAIGLGGTIVEDTTLTINDTFTLDHDLNGADRSVTYTMQNNEKLSILDTGNAIFQDSVTDDTLELGSSLISLRNVGSGGVAFLMNVDGSGVIGDATTNGVIDVESQLVVASPNGSIGVEDGGEFYLTDTGGQKWQVTVNTFGNLVTSAIP